MRWRHILLSLLAALPVTAGASAPPDDAIVVDGVRMTPEEERRAAADYTRRLGIARGEVSVARWGRPVCPAVKGIEGAPARLVMRTLRAIAAEAGAPLAREGCRGNLVVAFVDDGADMVRRLVRKRPAMLSQVGGPDLRALKDGDAPVRWWYDVAFADAGGAHVSSLVSPAAPGGGEGGRSPLPDGVPTSNAYSSSLIRTHAMRHIQAATVVVDVNRAEGAPLDAVAAYAAMVGLAEIGRAAAPDAASILNLLAPERRVAATGNGLGAWDRAMLRALYAIPLDRVGYAQRRQIVNALVAPSSDDPQ